MKKSEETSDDSMNLREKMKIAEEKSSLSNDLFARNSVLLPDQITRVKKLQEKPSTSSSSSGSATGNPRNKTALAPGHSLMDWIRLGNSGADLTGVGGVPRVVSLSELANHRTKNDAWIAIRGIVFNVTRYMDFHPGGVDELMRGVGKDATKLFENVHGWVNYQSILQKCVVGKLSRCSAEKPSPKASNKSSVALGLIKSCTKPERESPEPAAESRIPDVTMDWKQTSHSVTLFYRNLRDYPGVGYRLTRVSPSKLHFALFFEKNIVSHELELAGDVNWPPSWSRNFDTMQIDFVFPKSNNDLWKSQGNHTLSREPKTDKRTYRDYVVVSNTPLGKLVNLLVLRSKDFLEIVPIGRHVEVRMKVMDMEVSRAYTPVPACLHPEDLAQGYTQDCVCLMVKKYPDGALSPSLTALQTGNVLSMSNALGSFVVESFDRYSTINMLAGGTGLTVMLGILQRALARRAVKSVKLLNFNKDRDNLFYVEQLEKVSSSSKVKVIHALSQASDDWTGKRGGISEDILKEIVGEGSPESCVFTCGPKGFIQTARRCLERLKWKPYQTHEFDD